MAALAELKKKLLARAAAMKKAAANNAAGKKAAAKKAAANKVAAKNAEERWAEMHANKAEAERLFKVYRNQAAAWTAKTHVNTNDKTANINKSWADFYKSISNVYQEAIKAIEESNNANYYNFVYWTIPNGVKQMVNDMQANMNTYMADKNAINSKLNKLPCLKYNCVVKKNPNIDPSNYATLSHVVNDCFLNNSNRSPICGRLSQNSRFNWGLHPTNKPDPKFNCAYGNNIAHKNCRKLLGPVHPAFYHGQWGDWGRYSNYYGNNRNNSKPGNKKRRNNAASSK